VDYSIVLIPALAFFAYMSLLWVIGLIVKNAGLVDFGWPSGFTMLALYYGSISEGYGLRIVLIVGMYCLCGARFMLGWIVRTFLDGEDRRWEFWRQYWSKGEGRLGLRSISANLFAFYHAQTITTAFVLITPVIISCNNDRSQLYLIEWFAVALWLVSFILENVADIQLDRFRRHPSTGAKVCRIGLWKYSRHPNYFFEWMLWVAYALFALASASKPADYLLIILTPLVAYGFLVYYTGIPMTEKASLERRGNPYAKYQTTVNRFFPWFPRSENK
jgi:steroid 5-alpha reductase family enzyme